MHGNEMRANVSPCELWRNLGRADERGEHAIANEKRDSGPVRCRVGSARLSRRARPPGHQMGGTARTTHTSLRRVTSVTAEYTRVERDGRWHRAVAEPEGALGSASCLLFRSIRSVLNKRQKAQVITHYSTELTAD